MTSFADGLYQYGQMPVGTGGLPFGPNSKPFFWDATYGSDSNEGTTPQRAKKTLTAAYNLTTSGNHDTVFAFPNGADDPAASLTWSNNNTHLIGLGPQLRGMGPRVRIEGAADMDLTSLITVSGSGCVFSGIKWINLADADVDQGAMIVTGGRNQFYNCQISGMGHATPAARAGSYSLNISGEESYFHKCTIGLDTIPRGAANAEMIVASGATRLTFEECSFESASEETTKYMVSIAALDRWIKFINCDFYNFSDNHAVPALDSVFIVAGSSGTYHLRMLGSNTMIGFTGWADDTTNIQSGGPAANAGWGVAVAATT